MSQLHNSAIVEQKQSKNAYINYFPIKLYLQNLALGQIWPVDQILPAPGIYRSNHN